MYTSQYVKSVFFLWILRHSNKLTYIFAVFLIKRIFSTQVVRVLWSSFHWPTKVKLNLKVILLNRKINSWKEKNQIAGVNDENKLGLLTRESQLKFSITKISVNNENNQRTLGFTIESIKLNIDQNKHFSGYLSRAIIRIWLVWKIRPYQDKLGYLGSCAIVCLTCWFLSPGV